MPQLKKNRKIMIKNLFSVFLLLFCLSGFCQINLTSGFKKLYISEDNYSIMFPADWELENKDSLKYYFSIRRYKANSVNKHRKVKSIKI